MINTQAKNPEHLNKKKIKTKPISNRTKTQMQPLNKQNQHSNKQYISKNKLINLKDKRRIHKQAETIHKQNKRNAVLSTKN